MSEHKRYDCKITLAEVIFLLGIVNIINALAMNGASSNKFSLSKRWLTNDRMQIVAVVPMVIINCCARENSEGGGLSAS
jgi:uncharacterized membrane protein